MIELVSSVRDAVWLAAVAMLICAHAGESVPLALSLLNVTLATRRENDPSTTVTRRSLQETSAADIMVFNLGLLTIVVGPVVLTFIEFLYGKLYHKLKLPSWCRQREKRTGSITPLHRAAHTGDLAEVRQLLSDLESEPHNQRAVMLDARMAHNATPFMLACELGASEVAVALLKAGCDASATDDRGRTGVQLALLAGHETQDFSDLSQQRLDQKEDYFQDSFKLGFSRFIMWSTGGQYPTGPESASNWTFMAEGGFGKVFRCDDVWPPIEVSGERISSVAVKAAHSSIADDLDFRKEIADLAQLNHRNIVRILCFTQSQMEPGVTKVSWMLVMDYCVTDLEKIGGLKRHKDDYDVRYRTEELMLDLLTQTARGMDYIHSKGKMHWDLKPENVLVGNVGTESEPQWVARVADFGMAAAEKIPDWVGTFLFMAPEATKLNKDDDEQFGRLGEKADVFSFGIMVWMIFARKYRWFEDGSTLSGFRTGFQMPTRSGKNGEQQEDMKQVAKWYYLGQRPGFDGLYFPPKLVIVVEACWAAKQDDRPPFSKVLRVMESSAAELLEREPEPEPEPEITYGEFLAQLGMQDKKEALAELLAAGSELQELKQMASDDLADDVLEDPDLDLDEDDKSRFRQAVEMLSMGDDGSDQGSASAASAGDSAQSVCAAFGSLLAVTELNEGGELSWSAPAWDADAAAELNEEGELRWAPASQGKASSGSAMGASLLGDGDGDDSDGSSAVITVPEPVKARHKKWPDRKVGEEFAELELPPVKCGWEGEPEISLMKYGDTVVKDDGCSGVVTGVNRSDESLTISWDDGTNEASVVDAHTVEGRPTHGSVQRKYLLDCLAKEEAALSTRLGQRVWVADGLKSHWLEGTVANHTEAGRPLVLLTKEAIKAENHHRKSLGLHVNAESAQEVRCWEVVATSKPRGGRPSGRFTFRDVIRSDSSWATAVAINDSSPCSALIHAGRMLVSWHLVQPVMYFIAMYYESHTFDSLQLLFGCGVAVREGLYVLSVLACCVVNPAFLLVDVAASHHENVVFEHDASAGYNFVRMYFWNPQKFVVWALFDEGGLDNMRLRDVALNVISVFDLCGLAAFGAHVGPISLDFGFLAKNGSYMMVLFWIYCFCCLSAWTFAQDAFRSPSETTPPRLLRQVLLTFFCVLPAFVGPMVLGVLLSVERENRPIEGERNGTLCPVGFNTCDSCWNFAPATPDNPWCDMDPDCGCNDNWCCDQWSPVRLGRSDCIGNVHLSDCATPADGSHGWSAALVVGWKITLSWAGLFDVVFFSLVLPNLDRRYRRQDSMWRRPWFERQSWLCLRFVVILMPFVYNIALWQSMGLLYVN